MPRVPLRAGDLVVGQAVKWDVFDPQGKLLLQRGAIVDSNNMVLDLKRRQGVREIDLGLRNDEVDGLLRRRAGNHDERAVRMPLDETRIKPGDMIQVQEGKEAERMAVKLIGYQRGRSVIVSAPHQNGNAIFLREGSLLVARVFSGQLAFAFSSNVLAYPSKPYPHLHLSYPADVMGLKVRRGERVRLRVIVAIGLENGKGGAGVLSNLSVGGALLLTRSSDVSSGMGIVLKFKLILGGLEYLLELGGIVRSRVHNEEDPELGCGYGIQFSDMPPEDALIISSFVFQQLAENKTT